LNDSSTLCKSLSSLVLETGFTFSFQVISEQTMYRIKLLDGFKKGTKIIVLIFRYFARK
jgi:hypothetical protein